MDHLGQRLKDVRVRAGMTLRELARQADCFAVADLTDRERQVAAVGGHPVCVLPAAQRLRRRAVRGGGRRGSRGGGEGQRAAVAAAPDAAPNGHVDPVHAWRPSEYSNRVSVVHPTHRPSIAMAEGVVWERLAATPEHGVNFMKICYAPGATSSGGGPGRSMTATNTASCCPASSRSPSATRFSCCSAGRVPRFRLHHPARAAQPGTRMRSRASGSCTAASTDDP